MAGYRTPRILAFRANPYGSKAGRRHGNCKFRDRIDIHVEVPLVDFRETSSNSNIGEASAVIRQRVVAARDIQHERFRRCGHASRVVVVTREN